MDKLEQLELRFLNIVAKLNENVSNAMSKELNDIAIAINDLKSNSCGCGEAMRIKVVEDLIKNVERKFENK